MPSIGWAGRCAKAIAIALQTTKDLARVPADPDAHRLWLLAPRARCYAGRVVAAVDDAGAWDIMFSIKDAYHTVIEPNGVAGQVLAAAEGGTA
jgi:hypothetical protein